MSYDCIAGSGVQCTTHRGDMFFHSFLLTSYGIQVITGSETFTSKRHLLKDLTWLLALTILVTRAANRLDSTMDQELWMGTGNPPSCDHFSRHGT